MAEQSVQTPSTEQVETGGSISEPTATQPDASSGAVTDDEEMVTISKKDHKELIASRDRNHERARVTENWAIEQMQKEDIKDFLSDEENKKKYPNVKVDDLVSATKPEDFDEIAKQTQARIDQAIQERLGDIEKATKPTMSPEERAAIQKKLKSNPSVSSLEQAIEQNLAG